MTHPTQQPRRRRRAVILITAHGYALLAARELQGITASLAALHAAIDAHDAAGADRAIGAAVAIATPATDQENRP